MNVPREIASRSAGLPGDDAGLALIFRSERNYRTLGASSNGDFLRARYSCSPGRDARSRALKIYTSNCILRYTMLHESAGKRSVLCGARGALLPEEIQTRAPYVSRGIRKNAQRKTEEPRVPD